MRPLTKDPFDLQTCIRGLGNVLTWMHSDLYEYCYLLSIKRGMKEYKQEFYELSTVETYEDQFWQRSLDPMVRQCIHTEQIISDCKVELRTRWGINEIADMQNKKLEMEMKRFWPYFLSWKEAKSYNNLIINLIRSLESFKESLYLYACAITAHSNRIPEVLKKQYKKPEHLRLKLLNVDDNTVELLVKLITDIAADITIYAAEMRDRQSIIKVKNWRAISG